MSEELREERLDRTHRCSCGETFDTVDELLEHARDEHDAVV
jgi:hypothetical protein